MGIFNVLRAKSPLPPFMKGGNPAIRWARFEPVIMFLAAGLPDTPPHFADLDPLILPI